jgi:hypothetical protein
VIVKQVLQAPQHTPQEHPPQQHPPQAGGTTYHLVVTVTNQGSGEGQVVLEARLRSRATRQTAAQTSQNLDMQPHETASAVIPLHPPEPGDYEATVTARYPPM